MLTGQVFRTEQLASQRRGEMPFQTQSQLLAAILECHHRYSSPFICYLWDFPDLSNECCIESGLQLVPALNGRVINSGNG